MTDPITEAVARAIATENGDNWEELPGDKQDWVARQGHFDGRFRDVNEPYRLDYLAMATAAIRALYGALEREGWQVTRSEITGDMAAAAQERDDELHCSDGYYWDEIYRAMLAAAPKPPGVG